MREEAINNLLRKRGGQVCVFFVRLSTVADKQILLFLFTASLALWLRRPPRERKIPGSNPACAGIFFGVESYLLLILSIP